MFLHRLKQAISILILTILVGVSGVAIVSRIQGGHMLSVQTKSMVPKLNKGDLVSVKRVPVNQLKVGDIITFINPANKKQTITHRIITVPTKANGQDITTKGDANNVADKPIATSSVVGRVAFHVPKLGYGVDQVRKPVGLILIIYVPALAVIWAELQRLSAYYKTQAIYTIKSKKRRKTEELLLPAMKILPLIFLVPLLIFMPVNAALKATASLNGNTISAVIPQPAANILVSRVSLRCSVQNTLTANTRPRITLYNPTNKTIVLANWTLSDNNGVLISIPSGQVLRARHTKVIRFALGSTGLAGLQYAGDRVVLKNNKGVVVDGLSWGTDTSQLNPSLADITAGTRMLRLPQNRDTNTASDWSLSDHRCPGEEGTSHPGGAHPNHDVDDQQEADEDTWDVPRDPRDSSTWDICDRDPSDVHDE